MCIIIYDNKFVYYLASTLWTQKFARHFSKLQITFQSTLFFYTHSCYKLIKLPNMLVDWLLDIILRSDIPSFAFDCLFFEGLKHVADNFISLENLSLVYPFYGDKNDKIFLVLFSLYVVRHSFTSNANFFWSSFFVWITIKRNWICIILEIGRDACEARYNASISWDNVMEM